MQTVKLRKTYFIVAHFGTCFTSGAWSRTYTYISVMLDRRHDVSNHRQLGYFFNNLLRITPKNTPKFCIIGPLWVESIHDLLIPFRKGQSCQTRLHGIIRDSKVRVASMGPTWGLSAPGGPHVGPMNLAIRDIFTIANEFWAISRLFESQQGRHGKTYSAYHYFTT